MGCASRVSQAQVDKALTTRHAIDVQQAQEFIMRAAAGDLDLARLLLQRFKPEP